MRKYSKRRRSFKRKSSVSAFDLKLFFCAVVIFVASIIKFTDFGNSAEIREAISDVLMGEVEAHEALEVIGEMVLGEDSEVPFVSVFSRDDIIGESDTLQSEDEYDDEVLDEAVETVFMSEWSGAEEELLHPETLDFTEKEDETENAEEDSPSVVDKDEHSLPFEHVVPTVGTLTSAFGMRIHPIDGQEKFHYGVDLANTTGTEIVSFADGVIDNAGVSSVFGNYLIVEHSDGYTTLYAHLDKITTKIGNTVKKGDKIGEMGSTGLSTGSHLHFEIRHDGKIIDPTLYAL